MTNTSGLGVAAAGAQTVTLEMTARAEDGQMLAEATQNPRQINLAAGQLFQMDAATFFGIPTDALRSGWIEIRNLDAGQIMPVNGSVAFGSGQTGVFNTFSHVAQGEFGPIAWFTGLAFFFTGEGKSELLLTVRNADGEVTGRGQTTLSTHNRISKTLPELVPHLAPQAGGTVQVASTQEEMAFSLFGLAELTVAGGLPAPPTYIACWQLGSFESEK